MTVKLKIILTILFILAAGIAIPKIIIKNPQLGVNSCLDIAIKDQPKFPASVLKTAAIEEVNKTTVSIKYYTIFAIKLPQGRFIHCTLAK